MKYTPTGPLGTNQTSPWCETGLNALGGGAQLHHWCSTGTDCRLRRARRRVQKVLVYFLRVHKIQTLRIQCHFSGFFLLNTCNIFEKSKVALLSEITEEKYTKNWQSFYHWTLCHGLSQPFPTSCLSNTFVRYTLVCSTSLAQTLTIICLRHIQCYHDTLNAMYACPITGNNQT